jgi:hypothetical protein
MNGITLEVMVDVTATVEFSRKVKVTLPEGSSEQDYLKKAECIVEDEERETADEQVRYALDELGTTPYLRADAAGIVDIHVCHQCETFGSEQAKAYIKEILPGFWIHSHFTGGNGCVTKFAQSCSLDQCKTLAQRIVKNEVGFSIPDNVQAIIFRRIFESESK